MLRFFALVAVWVSPLAAAADPPAARAKPAAVPYRLTDTKHVLVRVKLNGKGPYNFILDTGAPAVFIPKKLAGQLDLNPDRRGWSDIESFDVEGGLSAGAVKCRVEDLFQLEGMNGLGLAGVELHGVIGYNVLAKYRITYDFTADKLVWVPLDFDPPALQRIGGGGQGGLEILGPVMKTLASLLGVSPKFDTAERGRLGIEIEARDAGLFVVSVLADSPAARAGFKAGDRLASVDGRPVKTADALFARMADKRAGQTVEYGLVRDGSARDLKVELGEGF